jgi:hypothetical protein
MKPIKTQYGQSAKIFNVEAFGTYSNNHTLKVQVFTQKKMFCFIFSEGHAVA